MYAKSKPFLLLLIALILVIQVVPVSAQGEMPPDVEVTISDEPSNEDANWPIIKTETHKRKDPSTGKEVVETTVVRQEPATKEKTDCKEKHKNKDKDGNRAGQSIVLAGTCVVNRYSVAVQAQVSVGGGSVTGYVKNIADEYCSSIAGCGFYKMKRIDVWWTRTATSFGVVNARVTWGCSSACALCTGSTTSYLWQSGFFNPTWSGLKTVTKTYTFSTMPIMSAMGDYGGYPIGGSDSTVTAPRSQTPLSVYTTFYSP